MKKAVIAIGLLSLYSAIRYFYPGAHTAFAEPTFVTGIMLISAYMVALLVKRIKLPKLTGYMLLGMAVGPIGLNFLTHDLLHQLHFLEDLALSFIALTAGGEFKYERFRKFFKSAVLQLSGQIVFVFLGIFVSLLILAPYFQFMAVQERHMVMGFSILFAGTALSNSPATTIGIITELRSKGRISELVLSITILKAIVVVMGFPLILGWAKTHLIAGTSLNMALLSDVGRQIFGSVFIGVAIGFVIIAYLKFIKTERSIFLLGIAIILTEVTHLFNMEILLSSIVAGIIVENFSEKGEALIVNIEKSSLPFYIIFFGFAGAGLHLGALTQAITLTVFLVVVRLLFMYLGNYSGAVLASETKLVKNISWMGYVGQAGIAVGLGSIIEKTFPGGVGTTFKMVLIATVVINELMGPVLFKYILIRAKESTVEG